jgi:hypothetical protein
VNRESPALPPPGTWVTLLPCFLTYTRGNNRSIALRLLHWFRLGGHAPLPPLLQALGAMVANAAAASYQLGASLQEASARLSAHAAAAPHASDPRHHDATPDDFAAAPSEATSSPPRPLQPPGSVMGASPLRTPRAGGRGALGGASPGSLLVSGLGASSAPLPRTPPLPTQSQPLTPRAAAAVASGGSRRDSDTAAVAGTIRSGGGVSEEAAFRVAMTTIQEEGSAEKKPGKLGSSLKRMGTALARTVKAPIMAAKKAAARASARVGGREGKGGGGDGGEELMDEEEPGGWRDMALRWSLPTGPVECECRSAR